MSQVRLLSPDHAAAYLGLGSRWAIYRLVAAGQLPALRLAGKLRIDRGDLDTLIDELKRPRPVPPVSAARTNVRAVPRRLGRLRPRSSSGVRPVTLSVTGPHRAG